MHLITRSCALFLWMQMLTFVRSQDCTLDQFLNGPLFDTNFDTSNLVASYPSGKQLRVNCNVGFTGFFKLICVEGTWQSRGAKCQPRSCGHPGDAQFADFHLENGDDFIFGSKVVYTCQKGYQMVSRTNFRRCMAQGWDGVVPVCEAQQCPVIYVDDNVLMNGDPEEATYGNVVRFSCKSNNEVLSGSSEMYCDENGDWVGVTPKCEVIKCTVPEIENGYVPGDTKEYYENEVLHFMCNSGYIRDDRPSMCIKIGSRADWSPTPVCEPIKCRLVLPAMQGTSFEPAYRNVFSPGETVRVNCGQKYWISDHQSTSAVTTCKDDGQWTLRPLCQEVTCINPLDQLVQSWDVYYWQTKKLGDTASYYCKRGYKKTNGVTRATCTRGGWTPEPLCQEIICNKKDVPNASIVQNDKETYKFNAQVRYHCNEGYRGRFTLTCGEHGWTGNSQCQEITCNRRYFPNADIVENDKQVYKYNDQVEYICRNDYKGSFTLTCGERDWIGAPECTKKQCKKLDIDNAYISRNEKETYSYNDQVQYKCRNDVARVFSIKCEEGVWTGIQNCSACIDPKIIDHGFTVDVHNDNLYYTCNEGYKLSTKGWWAEAKCIDGAWSGIDRCIENTMCGETPEIPNGKVMTRQSVHGPGRFVRITCKEGYQTQVDRLTCNRGEWDSNGLLPEAICTPVATPCDPPPRVENAVVVTSYQKEYLSDSAVTYQCRDKFTLVDGEGTIQCKNGMWETKNIQCTRYCDKLEDATITFDADKKRYMDGDVIEYQCLLSDVVGNATCSNNMWEKSAECDVPPLEHDAGDGADSVGDPTTAH